MELLRYDPLEHIDPDAWLELDETERKQLVVRYHRKEKIRLPNETTHALIHVIVENQLALGDEYPVKAVLARLMDEGLDRHDAIHAIGSVLSEIFFSAMHGEEVGSDLNVRYLEKLKVLSADSWRNQL